MRRAAQRFGCRLGRDDAKDGDIAVETSAEQESKDWQVKLNSVTSKTEFCLKSRSKLTADRDVMVKFRQKMLSSMKLDEMIILGFER